MFNVGCVCCVCFGTFIIYVLSHSDFANVVLLLLVPPSDDAATSLWLEAIMQLFPILGHKSFRMALFAFFNLSKRFNKWLFAVSASSNLSRISRCFKKRLKFNIFI